MSSPPPTPSAAPSLLAGQRTQQPRGSGAAASAAAEARTLPDLMVDGFYMLFLLKNRHVPADAERFRARVRDFLQSVERGGKRIGASSEDVYLAKYAYCALVDETVLATPGVLTASWQTSPLQLEMFGEQLAGEAFFDRLEQLRAAGAPRVQVLEVFHMCLLMGFEGKYFIEGSEKLGYLTARLGDEIAGHKGHRAGFAPHALAPDRISHKLRTEVPLWVMASVLALAMLLGFVALRWQLDRQTRADLAPYAQVVKLPAQAANVTITLP